ncbi:MAG: lipid-A-disaccharide synthase, partial [bacterium]
MKKIVISAGEVSGDIHAAALIQEIKKYAPSIRFYGMGGEKLRELL